MTYWSLFLAGLGWRVEVVVPHGGGPADGDLLRAAAGDAVERISITEIAGPGGRPGEERGGAATTPSRRLRRVVAGAVGSPGVPDRWAPRWRGTLPEVRRVVAERGVDAVLTSGPLHSIHVLGEVAIEQGRPWIADFRDPYIGDSRFGPRGLSGRVLRRRHLAFERWVHDHAAVVLHAGDRPAEAARRRHGTGRARIEAIPNGYPEAALAPLTASVPRARSDGDLRAVAAGAIDADLLARVGVALDRLAAAGTPVLLDVYGPEGRRGGGLGDRVRLHGRVPHEEALREIGTADLLLALLSERRAQGGGLSSKLFEYGATGRPILVVNPTAGDGDLLEERYDAFALLRSPTVPELVAAIDRLVAAGASIDPDREVVRAWRERFSREAGGRRLADLVLSALDPPGPPVTPSR